MSTSVDTMKNFFNVLKLYAYDTTTDAVAILDHAVSTVSRFSDLRDAVDSFIDDMRNVLAATGDPNQAVYQNCGIILGGEGNLTVDTGAVSGYYLGGGVVKDAQTIVPEPNVDLSQLSMPASNTTYHSYTGDDGKTINYAIVYPSSIFEVVDVATSPQVYNKASGEYEPDSALAKTTTLQAGEYYHEANEKEGDNSARLGEQVATSIVTMTKGVENFWADAALKLAYDSFGLDFDGKILTLQFGINQSSAAETGPVATDIGYEQRVPATNICMIIDSVSHTPIDASNVNGSTYITGGSEVLYVDRLIAHELIHGVMQAAGILKDGMPEFFREGVADLVQGEADYNSGKPMEIFELASDPARLAASLPFQEGWGNEDAYTAGYMFLTYLCHQCLNTQAAIGTGTAPETFTYGGGEEILSGEANGSQVNFASGIEVTETAAGEDDMVLGTTAGNLIIRDARGKLLNFANENGTVTGRSYLANESGIIDGRAFGEYEFICGANRSDNEIFAGDGGSRLWGGAFGTDMLIGGAGTDEFIVGVGCGSDVVNGVDSNDVINLAMTTLEQITGINATSGGVSLSFEDGSDVSVIGNNGASLNFKLGDGSAYTYSSGEWTKTA